MISITEVKINEGQVVGVMVEEVVDSWYNLRYVSLDDLAACLYYRQAAFSFWLKRKFVGKDDDGLYEALKDREGMQGRLRVTWKMLSAFINSAMD